MPASRRSFGHIARGPLVLALDDAAATLERLPGDVLDLNPDAGVWNYLEGVERKNCRCADLAELRMQRRRGKERWCHNRHSIRGSQFAAATSLRH